MGIVWAVVRDGRTMFVCSKEDTARQWCEAEMRRDNARRTLTHQPKLSQPRDYVQPIKLVES